MGAPDGSGICRSRGARVRQLGIRGRACKSRPRMAARLRGLPSTQGRIMGGKSPTIIASSIVRGAEMPSVRGMACFARVVRVCGPLCRAPDRTFRSCGTLRTRISRGAWRRVLGDRRRLLRAIAHLAEAASAAPQLAPGFEAKPTGRSRAPPSHGDVFGPCRFDGTLGLHGSGGSARDHFGLSAVCRRGRAPLRWLRRTIHGRWRPSVFWLSPSP